VFYETKALANRKLYELFLSNISKLFAIQICTDNASY